MGPGLCLCPIHCPFQPRDPATSVPTPAPALAKLVTTPAGCSLDLVLEPFKLISPGVLLSPFYR